MVLEVKYKCVFCVSVLEFWIVKFFVVGYRNYERILWVMRVLRCGKNILKCGENISDIFV